MNIRDANKSDARKCGSILYDAFKKLAEKHNFPPDFPSPEAATDLASMLIEDSGFYGVVAEEAGTIVGSNFMYERAAIFGIGPISVADTETCNKLCRDVHGFDRDVELRDAIRTRSASVVVHLDEITGYTTPIGFFAHAVARTNQDLKALIGAATEFPGPGFLLPTRNHEILEWCLSCRLRLVFQMTLMTTGLYNEPAGAYLPSIVF